MKKFEEIVKFLSSARVPSQVIWFHKYVKLDCFLQFSAATALRKTLIISASFLNTVVY